MALTIWIFLLLMNERAFYNCSYNISNKFIWIIEHKFSYFTLNHNLWFQLSSRKIIHGKKLWNWHFSMIRFFCFKAEKLKIITIPMQLSIKQELDLISIKFSYFGIIFFTFYVLKYLHIDIYCYLSTQRPPISSLLFTRQKICIS